MNEGGIAWWLVASAKLEKLWNNICSGSISFSPVPLRMGGREDGQGGGGKEGGRGAGGGGRKGGRKGGRAANL